MKLRPLGKTGINVSEIGFGAWGIGGQMWKDSDDKESMVALQKAVELGVNFFDTALVYGEGHSEQLVGKLLRSGVEKIFVATKVPPKNRHWPARAGVPFNETFPKNYILESANQSLKNLRMECIDVLQLHVWIDEWVGVDEDLGGRSVIEIRGENKSLRNFNQRPPACIGAQSGENRNGRHIPGYL